MSFEPHTPRVVSPSPLYPAAVFLGTVLFLLGYPSFLMIVHDLPSLPSLGLRRLFAPVGPLVFPFEELALALIYILCFILGYTFVFGRHARRQFILLSTALALIGYAAGLYLIAGTSPMQIYRLHTSCTPDGLSCYPYLAHGIVILFATALSMGFAERMLLRWAGRNVFGYPATRFPARSFALLACLLSPMAVYLLILMILDELFILLHVSENTVPEQSYAFHSETLAALAVAVLSSFIFAMGFVRNNWKYRMAGSIACLTIVLFCILVFLDLHLSGLSGRKLACLEKGSSVCPSHWERGGLLVLSFVWAIVLIERGFRHFAKSTIYQNGN